MIAEIATAFPGLFSYESLLMLDVRDLYWWERKARVANTRRKIDALSNMRLSMYGDEEFRRQVNDLIDQIELWERPKQTDQEIVQNWNERMNELKGIKKVR